MNFLKPLKVGSALLTPYQAITGILPGAVHLWQDINYDQKGLILYNWVSLQPSIATQLSKNTSLFADPVFPNGQDTHTF